MMTWNFTTLEWTPRLLVVVGAMNWGVLGIFGFNLMVVIWDEISGLLRLASTIIGLAGVYLVYDVLILRGKESS